MSRIGKKTINIPLTVNIFKEQNLLKIEGKYGKLEYKLLPNIDINISNNILSVVCSSKTREIKAFYGLTRALIQNKINDVTYLYSKTLITEGIGYKFQIFENQLILSVGYSHTIKLIIPEDIVIKLESPTKISISGINRENITQFAAKIRSYRPPEPYLGKGILYEGEIVRRKIGKAGKKK